MCLEVQRRGSKLIALRCLFFCYTQRLAHVLLTAGKGGAQKYLEDEEQSARHHSHRLSSRPQGVTVLTGRITLAVRADRKSQQK